MDHAQFMRQKLGVCVDWDSYQRLKISDYDIVYDKWQYVVVFGGNSTSSFYIGDYKINQINWCIKR